MKKNSVDKNFIAGHRKGLFLIFIVLILSIASLALNSNQISAQQVSYCAEKTLSGIWCDNVPLNQVNTNYRYAPTSCESFAPCKLGTCINGREGGCMPNTPQRVCQQNNGVWDQRDFDEIPQCQLGCCILGDEASFIDQARCKKLSADYGVETNFRKDIRDEVQCIASAKPSAKGACVFEEDFQRTCKLNTRSECQALEASLGEEGNVEFHEGLLCSAEQLATNCGPSEKTTCLIDKDEVYFLDTCGNLANVYDASKVRDQEYWTNIKESSEVCGFNSANGNANSATCGNCNYLLGSTCKAYGRGETSRPQIGDYICKDLSCRWEGKNYQHGETWCATSSQTNKGKNVPGEEHYRLVCYNNEVTIEQCDSFRNGICEETEITTTDAENGFSVAACKVNAWGECAAINNEEDCLDIENHDCQWIKGQTNAFFVDDDGKKYVVNADGELVPESESGSTQQASCVPKYAPGFNFWAGEDASEENSAEQWCPVANDAVIVKFENPLIGGSWRCVENCEYVTGGNPETAKVNSQWQSQRNNLCTALGDCGFKVNYIGASGRNNENATSITSQPPSE